MREIIFSIDFIFPKESNMLRKKFLSISSYTLLAGLIVLFLLTHSPNYTQFDAPSYINFDPIRPPLYPIFLWLFHCVGYYQFTVVVWIHAIITFLALLYTRSWLRKNLNINDFLIFIVLLFTILTICFHFQFILIGSEGLVFPFFIWTFFAFIECFKKFSIKKIIYLSLWVSIMILTRLQFYYFYGIYILLCGSYIYKKIPLKSLFIGILILSMSTLLTYLIDSTYHYFKHGFFGGAPATGLLISVQPLFLANDNEINNAFKDPKEKKYVQAILAEINQQQLNKDANLLTSTKLSYYQLAYESYNRNYPAINTITGNILSKNTPTMISKISLDIAKNLLFLLVASHFFCFF